MDINYIRYRYNLIPFLTVRLLLINWLIMFSILRRLIKTTNIDFKVLLCMYLYFLSWFSNVVFRAFTFYRLLFFGLLQLVFFGGLVNCELELICSKTGFHINLLFVFKLYYAISLK